MESLVSRREFIERTTCAAAAFAVMPQATPAARMFISQNGAVAPRTQWPDSARMAARVGYGGIDWSLGPAKTAGLEATRAIFAETKLRPTIVGLPMNGQVAFGEEAAFKTALSTLADDAAFAAAVGCHNMMLVLTPQSSQPRDERRKLVVERLTAIGAVLQKSNVRLGLEFLGPLYFRSPVAPAGGGRGGRQGAPAADPATPPPPPPLRIPFIWTLPETVALGKDSGPNVGAVLDIWHWYHSGGTVADILATEKERIVHVHLSDARAMEPADVRDNMRLMPGEGQIDVTAFLQALRKIGYTGGVAPEPLGRIPMDMAPEEASKLGFDTTLAAMKKASITPADTPLR